MLYNARLRAKAELAKLHIYALDALYDLRKDQVRTVIFAQGRTGSTLLESLLGSTGHFATHGEILSCDAHEVGRPASFVRGKAKQARTLNSVFHLKIYHMTRDRRKPVAPAAFLSDLNADGWKIIHLIRRNVVKHALSTLVAEARGEYHRFDDSEENISIDVDLQNFRRLLTERLEFARQETGALGNLPRIELSYEDDLADESQHQVTVDKLLDEFGLERRAVSAATKKVNRFCPQDLIKNFDEVDKLVRSHGLNW